MPFIPYIGEAARKHSREPLWVMTKTVLHIAISALLVSACNSDSSVNKNEGNIEIGNYIIHFPQDYKLIKEKGIDSYVGKISNGQIDFPFDYGYYSNSLNKSVDKYLSEDTWKWNALGRNNLLPEGDVTGMTDDTELISYSTSDSIEYELLFLHKSDTIEYVLTVPEEIRKVNIQIDTIENVMYKFVRSDDYVGLYAKDLKSFNKSINSYRALSIIATQLSPEETEKCYEILRSCKLKN